MYIDTHAHLNFKAFNEDYKDAIKRARDAEVMGIINVGSNTETSQKAIQIAHEFEHGVWAAVGLHPIHVIDEDFDFDKYLELAKDEEVVAIGETGIDLYHNKTTIVLQKDVFNKSLEIALEVGKPAIIHSREADDEVLDVLQSRKSQNPKAVLHCFGRDWITAKKFLDLGFTLSFTGNITYHLTPEREEMLKKVPLDRIMIETDCPFMAPVPYRGSRNEPAYVIEVAKQIAKIKKTPLAKVQEETTKNAIKLFGLDLK